MAVNLLTVSQYARHRGVDEKAVRYAIGKQRITVVEQGGKRLIDPEVADIQWARNTRARAADARRGAPPTAGSGNLPDYQREMALKARADREMAELEVARAAGRALDRERAERGAFDAFRELRDGSFGAMKTAARQVLGLTELREVEIALEDALRHAFADWEQRMRRRLDEAAQT